MVNNPRMNIKMENIGNNTCEHVLCAFIYSLMIYFIFFTLHDKQSFVINSSILIKCLHFCQVESHFVCCLYNAITKYVCNKDLSYEGRITSRVTISSPTLWSVCVPLLFRVESCIRSKALCYFSGNCFLLVLYHLRLIAEYKIKPRKLRFLKCCWILPTNDRAIREFVG